MPSVYESKPLPPQLQSAPLKKNSASNVALNLVAILALTTAASVAAEPAAGPGQVDVQRLLGKNACLSCHGVTQKIVGPGYSEVAERYRLDAQAQSKLEGSIRAGSVGKWGEDRMPSFEMLTPEEIKALAEFVRQQ